MATKLAALCEQMADLLTQGRLSDLAGLHVFPCPYETRGSLDLMVSPSTLASSVGDWLAAQRARGVREIRAQVMAQEIPRGSRLRAWVRWTHRLADGSEEDGGTDLLYLLCLSDGRLLIEMIDFLGLSSSPGDLAVGSAA